MASGVQGMMDLTVPAGGSSPLTSVAARAGGVFAEARRDFGSMNRTLNWTEVQQW